MKLLKYVVVIVVYDILHTLIAAVINGTLFKFGVLGPGVDLSTQGLIYFLN